MPLPASSRRRAALIAGLLCVGAVGPCVADDPSPGGQAWSDTCAKCHRSTEAIAYALPDADDRAGKDRLNRFLAMHHAPDDEARAALVNWLADQASQ